MVRRLGAAVTAAWMVIAAAMASPMVAAPADPGSLRLPPTAAPAGVGFAIVKTSAMETQEGFVYEGGSLFSRVAVNHVAVLVRHPRGTFLFDTGLGRHIDAQYGPEMSWWAKPLISYGSVTPARDQLDAAGIPPVTTVILSHGHWDHASGLVDFPEGEVWVTEAEKRFLDVAGPPAVLPSQVRPASIRWRRLTWHEHPYAAYPLSLDLYGDGSVVLVSQPGHTPGSVGMFVTVGSGKRYFFVGDTVWKADAAVKGAPKFWLASRVVDHDREETLAAIEELRAVMLANPDLVVVPAHDAAVQDALGYFPHWIE